MRIICLKKALAILLSVLLATPLFVLTTFAEGDGFTRLPTASTQCETGEMWYNRSALASATGTEGYRTGYFYISDDANTIKIEYVANSQPVTELRTRDTDAQYFDYLFVIPAFGDPLPTSEDGLEDGAYWYDQAGLIRLAQLSNSSESIIYIYTHAVFRLSVDETMLRMVYTTQNSEDSSNRDEFASSANVLYGFLRQKGVDPNAGFTLLPTSEEGLEDGDYWFDLSSFLETLSESNQQIYANAQYYLSDDGVTLRISVGMNIDVTREDEAEVFIYLRQVGVDPNAGFTLLPTTDEGLEDGAYWYDAAGLAAVQDAEELLTAQYYLSDDGNTIRLITPSIGQLDVARDSDSGKLLFPYLRQVGVDPNAIEGFLLLPFSDDGLEEGDYWFDAAALAEVTGNEDPLTYLYYLSDDGNTIHIKYDASFSLDIARDGEYSATVFPYLRQVGVDPNSGFIRLPKSADGLETGTYWFDAAGFAAMTNETSSLRSLYYLSDDGNTLRINSSGYVFDVTKGSPSASVYFIYLHKVGEVYMPLPISDEGLEVGDYWFDASGWANYADDESYQTATYSLNAEAGILCIIIDGEEAYYMNGGEYSILFQFLKQAGVDPNAGFTPLPTSTVGLHVGDYWFDAAAFGASVGFEEDEISQFLAMLSCYLSEDGETLRLIFEGNVIDIPADDENAEEYWTFLHQVTVDPNAGFTLLPTTDQGLEDGAYWYYAAGLNVLGGGAFSDALFYLSDDCETLRVIVGNENHDLTINDEDGEVFFMFLRQVGVDPNAGFVLLPTSPAGLTDGDYWFDAVKLAADEDDETYLSADFYLSEDGTTLRASLFGYRMDVRREDDEEFFSYLHCVGESADAVCVTLTAPTETFYAGDTVVVTVDLAQNPGLAGTKLSILYDVDMLTLTDVQAQGMMTTGNLMLGGDLNASPFNILWDDATAQNNHTETGTILTLTFTVKDGASAGKTSVTMTYDTYSTFDVDLKDVPVFICGTPITIAVHTPGDVNGDGAVDLKDVTALNRYLAGGWDVTINERNSDVNADGVLDLKDVVLIRRFLAGGWDVELV